MTLENEEKKSKTKSKSKTQKSKAKVIKNNLTVNNKKQKPTTSFVKRKVYVRGKLLVFKRAYGASFSENNRFYLSLACKHFIIQDHHENKEILNNVNEDVKQTKKKKNLSFIYYILNIVIIAAVLAIQLSQESNPMEAISAIAEIDWWFVVAAFGTFVVCMLMDALRYGVLIHKATGVFRFRLGYKVGALGKYYDTITPLSTGGQPFQVIYTNKYGIKPGDGISIAMGRYIFYQIVYFTLVSIFAFKLIFSPGSAIGSITAGDAGQGFVSTFMWIGYAMMAVVIITILFMSLNKRAGAGFVIGILKLLSKIHIGKFRIIKDYKKTFAKVMRTVNLWQSTTKKYCKSFWVISVNFIASIIYFFAMYSMPFFIYCAFEGWPADVWQTLSTIISFAVIVDLTSAFNPIPMGAGTADISFTVLYGAMFSVPGAAIWALIIWRILAHYIYIIQGLVLVNYDYFIGNKRLEKYKDFWCLPLRERLKIKLASMKKKKAKAADHKVENE